MLFDRDLEQEIQRWIERKRRKPLILRGVRQVGKTTLVIKISTQFDHFVSLNLELEKDAQLFRSSDNVEAIFEAILLKEQINLKSGQKLLLFLDEIQEEPKAIQLLRYFYEKIPDLFVIAAGSLLEFALSNVKSFPVGRVEQIVLHPMNFQEYLAAIGKNNILEAIKTLNFNGLKFEIVKEEFHRYLQIGGMPEVIQEYIENNYSLIGLDRIFNQIWETYIDDIEKYSSSDSSRQVLKYILQSSPFELDRISFSKFGKSEYRSREIGDAFRLLDLARIIKIIYPTTNVQLPLIPNLKKQPKLQFLDTGLLMHLNQLTADVLLYEDLNNFFRGQILAHVVFQEFISLNSNVYFKPNFWVREKSDANSEVDLVIGWKGKIIPIEIKSGPSGRLRSLHEFMDRAPHDIAVRFLANDLSIENTKTIKGKAFRLINVPYFACTVLFGILEMYAGDSKPT